MRGQLEGVLDLVILDVSLPDGDSRVFCPACGRKARCLLFSHSEEYGKGYDCRFDAGLMTT
ncbi:MAG: hypothetical protein ACLVAW_29720 [Eisenbergiella massiliensis]